MRGCAPRLPEVIEIEALVLSVSVAGRILETEQLCWRAAEHLREGPHERDRTTAANHRGLAAKSKTKGSLRCIEGGAHRFRTPPRNRGLAPGLHGHAPWRIPLQKGRDELTHPFGILSRR